jgi:hypothetical protein
VWEKKNNRNKSNGLFFFFFSTGYLASLFGFSQLVLDILLSPTHKMHM